RCAPWIRCETCATVGRRLGGECHTRFQRTSHHRGAWPPSLSGEALMSRIGKTWLVWIVGIALVACTDPTQPATAVQLAFIVQPSQTVQGARITPPVQVAAQDSFGNLAIEFQDSVTVALPANPPIASLSGNTVVRAVNGVATFNDLSIARVNAGYTLIA